MWLTSIYRQLHKVNLHIYTLLASGVKYENYTIEESSTIEERGAAGVVAVLNIINSSSDSRMDTFLEKPWSKRHFQISSLMFNC